MSKYSYKNESDADLVIVGFGVVKAGESFESDTEIENPNLSRTETKAKTKSVNKESGDVD